MGRLKPRRWQYLYDPVSTAMTSVVDPNNHMWSAGYDADGESVVELRSAHSFDQRDVQRGQRTATQTDAKNVTTTSTYDLAAIC